MQSESQQSIQSTRESFRVRLTRLEQAVYDLFDRDLVLLGQVWHIDNIQEEIRWLIGSGHENEVKIALRRLLEIGRIYESSPKNFRRVTE